ncbi:immunoglobulin-like domain-containing protein [Hyalangium rubrum]|uniref:DUF5011 domain-containing protein n=1 Tax=Hyalangium rubrum TaxID=3103134 RepID=A0ABU5GYH2_9BACT|nr:immunoglobulin-like domain-containing protein [Hyalangium sp. s54d21]MDY7224890.1 DUF5011 domain-containing protein [Hyalangium sp. s54d21]
MPSLARALPDWKPLWLALAATAPLLLPGTSHAATTCAEVRAQNPSAGDGTYSLTLGGQQVAVHCHDMAGTPREYLTLPSTGSTTNYSYYGRGPNTAPGGQTTWYTKARFDPAALALTLDDTTFATSEGWKRFGNTYVYSSALAGAGDCVNTYSQTGRGNVDLTGTPFDIVPGQFRIEGNVAAGSATFSGPQIVNLTGGGYCGGIGTGNNQLRLAWRSAPPEPCDSGEPSIVLNGYPELTLECGSAPYSDPGAQAFDGCGNPIQVHAYNTGTDASGPGPNTSAEGSYSVSYAAWDAQGHTVSALRTVNVEDRTAPTLTLNGPGHSVHTCGSPWVDPGASATDACYGNLTSQVERSGEVNGWAAGQYTVTYTLTDSGGNSAAPVTRTVDVVDCPW